MMSRFKEQLLSGVPAHLIDTRLHKGPSTQTVSNEPPAWAIPYLTDIGKTAGQLSDKPQKYFPGSTVVPFSGDTRSAMGMMRQTALDPNSAGNMGVSQLGDTISGQYLPDGDRFSAITDPVRNAVNAQFSLAGRYGSGSHDQAVTKAMMEAAQPYYDAERGRMMTASAIAPQAQMSALAPLMQAGQMAEDKSGQYLQDKIARWDFGQNEPWNRLSRYASIINPGAGLGGTQTTTMPSGSRLSGALGGGLMGAQLGSLIPGFGAGGAGATGLAALGPAGIGLGLLGMGLGAFG